MCIRDRQTIVDRFVQAGYRIALDDFGAEYSNIYVLYSLKLNSLKLDRRIVSDIYHDSRARLVVEHMIEMCKKMGIKCVAEGVETEEHLSVLREMGCDVIQGYYLNKPLPEEEFFKLYVTCLLYTSISSSFLYFSGRRWQWRAGMFIKRISFRGRDKACLLYTSQGGFEHFLSALQPTPV